MWEPKTCFSWIKLSDLVLKIYIISFSWRKKARRKLPKPTRSTKKNECFLGGNKKHFTFFKLRCWWSMPKSRKIPCRMYMFVHIKQERGLSTYITHPHVYCGCRLCISLKVIFFLMSCKWFIPRRFELFIPRIFKLFISKEEWAWRTDITRPSQAFLQAKPLFSLPSFSSPSRLLSSQTLILINGIS